MPQFVVVPEIPKDVASMRHGARFYCQTEPIGFSIFGNEQHRRLQTSYRGRDEAEKECNQLNRNAVVSI